MPWMNEKMVRHSGRIALESRSCVRISGHDIRPGSEGGNNMRNIQVKSDLDLLLDLNRDYIRSVQTSDARRFDEILAEDFLCSNPDGSLGDQQGFLKQTTLPDNTFNLEAYRI